MTTTQSITLGLAANWRQFTLLVVINAFVGAMVGLERAALPLVASREFNIASTTVALAFIAAFGIAKAFTNLVAGRLADRGKRRNVLILGWLVAFTVPPLLLLARDWSWIVAANVLLGVSQGLAWSMTVIMKIDLVGPARRGFAMGLNEAAGYGAIALSALLGGALASRFGLREGPAWAGMGIAFVGLLLSVLFTRDTSAHVVLEQSAPPATPRANGRGAFAIRQAGFVNNLNDGLAWGLFPLLFASAGLSMERATLLVATYPAVWGVTQLWTGIWSDRLGRKAMIVWGLLLRGAALVAIAVLHDFTGWLFGAVALGVGTAMVYPALLAAVADIAPPSQRGAALGAYRFWRDMGYVGGALAAGLLSDRFGMNGAIVAVGLLTAASGLVVIAAPLESAALEIRT